MTFGDHPASSAAVHLCLCNAQSVPHAICDQWCQTVLLLTQRVLLKRDRVCWECSICLSVCLPIYLSWDRALLSNCSVSNLLGNVSQPQLAGLLLLPPWCWDYRGVLTQSIGSNILRKGGTGYNTVDSVLIVETECPSISWPKAHVPWSIKWELRFLQGFLKLCKEKAQMKGCLPGSVPELRGSIDL